MRLAAAAAVMTAALAAPASAAPGGGEGQTTFPMMCDGEAVTLTIGGGTWAAAYVAESGRRFLPKATLLQVVDVETGEVLDEILDAKPSAARTATTACQDVSTDGALRYIFTVKGKVR
jgi:hypothetical protein